jgi:hypothetical protein
MALTSIGLIAPHYDDHVAWRLALRRIGPDICSVYPEDAEALPALDLWVIVLRGLDPLLIRPEWASCLTARTLLVADANQAARRLAQHIRHPVLITTRLIANQELERQIALLNMITSGHVIYLGHARPQELAHGQV